MMGQQLNFCMLRDAAQPEATNGAKWGSMPNPAARVRTVQQYVHGSAPFAESEYAKHNISCR
jgi:hypothetical protein